MSKSLQQITISATKKPMSSGAKKGGGKHKLRHMTVTPMVNGGATVEHHFMPNDNTDYGPTPRSETHGFTKAKDAGKHVTSVLEGMPGTAPAAAAGGAAPAMPSDNDGDEE